MLFPAMNRVAGVRAADEKSVQLNRERTGIRGAKRGRAGKRWKKSARLTPSSEGRER